MLTDIELLCSIRQTAEMGRDGIDTVMRYSPCQPLSDALRQQKAEYGELSASAGELIRKKGGYPEPVSLGSKMGLQMVRISQRFSHPSASRIAEKMISGNTKGVVQSLRRQRQYLGRDPEVMALSQRLLETEQNNIEQMKPFL